VRGSSTPGPAPGRAETLGPPAAAHAPGRGRGRALLLASSVLFGLAAMWAKVAARAGMGGGQATLVRFVLGLSMAVAVFRARPGSFRPGRYGLLAVRGLVGGISALLYYLAIARIPAGEATLLNNLFPIFAVIFSFFTLGERPTGHLALALLVASAGVWLVLGGGSIKLRLGGGEWIALLSAVAGGVAVTAIRALRSSVNAITIFSSFAAGGALVSLPFGLSGWPGSPLAWAAALAAALAAFFAQMTMTESYGALSVPEAAVWQQLTPIAAYLCALPLGERPGGMGALGVLLGVGGVAYGSLLGHRPGPAARPGAGVPVLPAEEP